MCNVLGEIRNYLVFFNEVVQMVIFNPFERFDVHLSSWIYFQHGVVQPVFFQLVEARLFKRRMTDLIQNVIELSERFGTSPGKISRISILVDILARTAGYGEEFIDEMKRAVPFCDIGRLMIDGSELNLPASLTEARKRALCEQIAGISLEVAAGLLDSSVCRQLSRYQFERSNGSGYPLGLSGDTIPKAARIYAIAAAYDALRRDRPYRKACSHDEALAALAEGAASNGTGASLLFDPDYYLILKENSATFDNLYIPGRNMLYKIQQESRKGRE